MKNPTAATCQKASKTGFNKNEKVLLDRQLRANRSFAQEINSKEVYEVAETDSRGKEGRYLDLYEGKWS